MSEHPPSFLTQIKSFPSTFWIANTMEILERMSWYGWFTVMALYVTGSVETGGLGFTTETRGALQAIVPFFLYMFPVFTGALADRYGFKRIFIVSYMVMIVAYYLLGQFTTLPTFFMAFMFVAIGAALFKPVVTGTIAKVTNDGNSATGFGVFYMMVNIGGFVGPIVAGRVRGWGWEYVFIACSAWAVINLIVVLTLYKEPPVDNATQRTGSFQSVLDNMVEVLGNVRFFLTVFVVLFALMFANLRVGIFGQFTWTHCAIFVPVWILLNFVWDRMLPAGSGAPDKHGPKRGPLMKRMYCSNWRFAVFLLIMSGFWASFNQIFYTMPEYIRDFADTRPMISLVEKVFGDSDPNDPNIGPASSIATINDGERAQIVHHVQPVADAAANGGAAAIAAISDQTLKQISLELLHSKVRVPPQELSALALQTGGDVELLANQIMIRYRQVNPEFIVNIDAGAIVLFQVLVSFLMAKFHRFTTMIIGMLIAAVGIALSAFAGGSGMIGLGGSIWVVALGLFIFAVGEMMASPTSQEYVGRIAPGDKKALYMGYYFVAIALGNLFGGILSGELYGTLARDMQRPDLMWLAFGGIMMLTAVVFLLYNRFALPKDAAHTLTAE